MDTQSIFALPVALLALLLWAAPAHATFPGENGKLAFERTQIFTVNPNGSALTPITPETGFFGREPAFSPDGRLIAFDRTSGGSTGWGIWVMSNTGTGAHQITRESQAVADQDTYPFWSPNGQKIGFVRDRDILVMNADGSGTPENLTENFLNAAIDPDWSPRGDLIAFSDGGDIYVVAADGSTDPQLIPAPIANQRYPSWSPDGNTIAYATNSEVRRTTPSGSGDTLIVGGFREVWDLAWSPDGTRIGFINDPGTNIQVQEELYMVNADGTGAGPVGVDTSTNLDWGIAATGPPPPVLGETATVREVKGKVFIGIPSSGARAAQKGVDFVPLEEARDIPIGSFLDTRKGTVALSTARDRRGRVQSGRFNAGLFQVLQSRKRRAKGLTELRLKGSSFRTCRRAADAGAARLSRRTIRRLRARARGRYRTRGRYSAASVRGTTWTVEDRCDGTLTTVKRGTVVVRDFRLKRNITLDAGNSYLAKARP